MNAHWFSLELVFWFVGNAKPRDRWNARFGNSYLFWDNLNKYSCWNRWPKLSFLVEESRFVMADGFLHSRDPPQLISTSALILLGNAKFAQKLLISFGVYTSVRFRPNHIRKIDLVTVLKVIANLFPSKNNDDGMARFTIKKCPTGCEVNFVFLQRNSLMKLVDAKVKNGYRFRWGTFPRDKKDVQVFTLQYSLFKLWMLFTLLTMHPTLLLRIASTILSIIFTWW